MFFVCTTIFAQQSTSPYQWNWTRDGIWTSTALGTSTYGLHLIKTKDDITQQELDEIIKDKGNINFLDKWVAGNNSDSARNTSDIPFVTAFVTPLFLLIDDDINDHSFQIMGLYLETIATTGAIYTITAGLANRTRPYVYSDTASEFKKLSKNGQRSFYSGHVAATTTATFFAAKVYQDFHPNSKALPYIWAGAAA